MRERVSLGDVASAARVSARISVDSCSDPCSCSCIGTSSVVRHLVRHDTQQDGRIGNPRSLFGPDGGDGLFVPQRKHVHSPGPGCLGSLRVLVRHFVLGGVLLRHVFGARLAVLVIVVVISPVR